MSDEPAILLFSYGTLQQENVQLSSFGRLLKGEDDTMQGYRQSMLEILDPDVVARSGKKFHPVVEASPDPADSVAGKVFEITEAELAAADRYEVADYKRVNVQLGSGKAAWAYIKA